MKGALVVAAHPDDELLGPGAFVSRLADEGFDVRCVVMAEGVTSRSVGEKAISVAALREVCVEASKEVGYSRVTFLEFPDNRMDEVGLLDVVQSLESTVSGFSPGLVLTHSLADLNVDHRITAQAVSTVFRPLPNSGSRAILSFETLSSTEWGLSDTNFRADYFVEVSEVHLGRKLSALARYESEMRLAPHPRSLDICELLARVRGSIIGVEFAEAFEHLRSVRTL